MYAAAAQDAEGTVLDVGKGVSLHPRAADAAGATQEQTDPHFWLDPLLMADLGDAVAAELSDLDPDKGSTYRTNSSHLRSDLEAIDQGLGGRQVEHRLGDKGPRQGHSILRRTPDATPAGRDKACLLYTSPSPRDRTRSRMPSSA